MIIALLLQVVIDSNDLLKGEGTVAKTAPRVEITIFEGLPDSGKGTLWSSWGDGLIASNGKYYTAIGDHRGFGATSKVYEYDGKLREIVDVGQFLGLKPDEYGHGKIHAGIHEWEGGLYFATYWGKGKEVPENWGGLLFRIDLKTEKIENLGVVAKGRGLPASHFDPERALLYFHSVSPDEGGELLVYDLKSRKIRFQGGGDIMEGKRAFLRDLKGRVYFSCKDGTLGYYDPETNALGATNAKLPGSKRDLRAGSRPTKEGLLHGMTGDGRLFAFDGKTVKDFGPNFGEGDYTAVMVLSPDEKYIYFAPGAHGSGVRTGTAVVQYEIATGRRKALAFLNGAVRERLKYNVGGSYNLQIDPAGERLMITFNGAPLTGGRKEETFGRPCVVVLYIPRSER